MGVLVVKNDSPFQCGIENHLYTQLSLTNRSFTQSCIRTLREYFTFTVFFSKDCVNNTKHNNTKHLPVLSV